MTLKDWKLTKTSRQETIFTNKNNGKRLITQFVTFPETRWEVVVGKGQQYVDFARTKGVAMKHAKSYMRRA